MPAEKICPITKKACLIGCRGEAEHCFMDQITENVALAIDNDGGKISERSDQQIRMATGPDILRSNKVLTSDEQEQFKNSFFENLQKRLRVRLNPPDALSKYITDKSHTESATKIDRPFADNLGVKEEHYLGVLCLNRGSTTDDVKRAAISARINMNSGYGIKSDHLEALYHTLRKTNLCENSEEFLQFLFSPDAEFEDIAKQRGNYYS